MAVNHGPSLAQDITASTFAEYALSGELTLDETYTVELLIERVRDNFDENYWDGWSERADARRTPNYKPMFSPDHVGPATQELQSLSWLNFQRGPDDERPVRDITALRFLPRLTGLVLTNNHVWNLTPLSSCSELRQLRLNKNPIRDISPLANCVNIEELHLGGCPIADFSALQFLPNLREISISVDQIAAFKQLKRLPHLRKLECGLDTFESFVGFPEMPELRVIRNAHVKSLDGLQHFPKLQNLINLTGGFDSLEPLRNLTDLTHANILSSRVKSLQPLAELPAFRELFISTTARKIDLSPLKLLPSLHEVNVTCNGMEPAGLSELKASLPPWDIEFLSPTPRHTPSLELVVVDQNTFDIYDTKKPFNVDSDENEGLLSSELEWLDDKLERLLSADFQSDDDYTIPFKWNGARSRTIVLFSDKSVAALPKLVLGIQEVLSNAKKDWIVYLHTDDASPEFVVWVYPDKIMVTHEYVDALRMLLDSKDSRSKR
jgi:Leucine-rich repeat (LRR) protein